MTKIGGMSALQAQSFFLLLFLSASMDYFLVSFAQFSSCPNTDVIRGGEERERERERERESRERTNKRAKRREPQNKSPRPPVGFSCIRLGLIHQENNRDCSDQVPTSIGITGLMVSGPRSGRAVRADQVVSASGRRDITGWERGRGREWWWRRREVVALQTQHADQKWLILTAKPRSPYRVRTVADHGRQGLGANPSRPRTGHRPSSTTRRGEDTCVHSRRERERERESSMIQLHGEWEIQCATW